MYSSVADFKTYHTDRGRSIPVAMTDAVIAAALLVASEWLDGAYGSIWIGTPTGGFTQTNLWPRTGATTNTDPSYTFADDEIPDLVNNAACEAAWREAISPGALNIDFTPSKYSETRVEGAIQVKYRTDFTSTSDVQTQIGIIQTLMRPLVDPESLGQYSQLSGESVRVK